MTVQQIFEKQGFIVIAFIDSKDMTSYDASGLSDGRIKGFLHGVVAKVVGPATEAEWNAQCILSGDDGEPPFGYGWIGFRKIVAE